MWPRIAGVFGMKVGEVQTISLSQHMADKAELWAHMTKKHGLKKFAFDQLVAEGVRRRYEDLGIEGEHRGYVLLDVTKSRLHGFHDVVDSEAMFERLLRRFRKEKIVP